MKNMFLKKLVTAVSLSLAVVLGASSVASARPGDTYNEYSDDHGGILRHWSRTQDRWNGKHVSAETECHRHGRWIGSYTITYFQSRAGGEVRFSSGRYCGDGTFSHAESVCPTRFRLLYTACTNCGPKDA